jgi:hypothetical protein
MFAGYDRFALVLIAASWLSLSCGGVEIAGTLGDATAPNLQSLPGPQTPAEWIGLGVGLAGWQNLRRRLRGVEGQLKGLPCHRQTICTKTHKTRCG